MTLLIALFVSPFVLLTLCFAVEVLAGLRPYRRRPFRGAKTTAAVIIVPAHNEELVLRLLLPRLKEAAAKHARILVVADNCTDATADTARRCHVQVIERVDRDRRGKGFALDFARQSLQSDPPEIVLVVDADCVMDSKSLAELISECVATGRPCQALYVQVPVPSAPPTVQLSTFAFFVRNVIRQRGLGRLAGRVHLVGTGMAFPWQLFERAALASDNIVEDLQLGLELADQGFAPLLVEQALVSSDAATAANTFEQRRRWEGGYLSTARRWVPTLLVKSSRQLNVREFWAAISLSIPPLALLLLMDVVVLACAIGALSFGAGPRPALVMAAALSLVFVGLILAWASGGSRFVPLKGLAQAPLYVLWKIPLYLGLIRRGAPRQWVRTGRE